MEWGILTVPTARILFLFLLLGKEFPIYSVIKRKKKINVRLKSKFKVLSISL